jgi:hypothetical protein
MRGNGMAELRQPFAPVAPVLGIHEIASNGGACSLGIPQATLVHALAKQGLSRGAQVSLCMGLGSLLGGKAGARLMPRHRSERIIIEGLPPREIRDELPVQVSAILASSWCRPGPFGLTGCLTSASRMRRNWRLISLILNFLGDRG